MIIWYPQPSSLAQCRLGGGHYLTTMFNHRYWVPKALKRRKTLAWSGSKNFLSLHKIQYFHLVFWCGNFVGRYSFRKVLGGLPKALRKLCLSTKSLHQEIRWNYDILRSAHLFDPLMKRYHENGMVEVRLGLRLASIDWTASIAKFIAITFVVSPESARK